MWDFKPLSLFQEPTQNHWADDSGTTQPLPRPDKQQTLGFVSSTFPVLPRNRPNVPDVLKKAFCFAWPVIWGSANDWNENILLPCSVLSNADKCVSSMRSACNLNFALANTTSINLLFPSLLERTQSTFLPTLAEPYDKFPGQPLEVTLWIKPHIEPPAKERSGWQQHPSKWNSPKTKSHFLHHSSAQLPLPQVAPHGHL